MTPHLSRMIALHKFPFAVLMRIDVYYASCTCVRSVGARLENKCDPAGFRTKDQISERAVGLDLDIRFGASLTYWNRVIAVDFIDEFVGDL